MITEEEKQEIIDKACEKALLCLPEVVNALWKQKMEMQKLAKKFYDDNAEFGKHTDIVGSILERLEGENPGVPYASLLDKAKDKIKTAISQQTQCDHDILKGPPLANGSL